MVKNRIDEIGSQEVELTVEEGVVVPVVPKLYLPKEEALHIIEENYDKLLSSSKAIAHYRLGTADLANEISAIAMYKLVVACSEDNPKPKRIRIYPDQTPFERISMYLCTITSNLCTNYHRDSRRSKEELTDGDLDIYPSNSWSPERVRILEEEVESALEALGRLSETQRQTLVQYLQAYLDNDPSIKNSVYKRMVKLFGRLDEGAGDDKVVLAANALKQRVLRARRAVRELLKEVDTSSSAREITEV